MKIDAYSPFQGGTYIETTKLLKNKGACNVKALNETCLNYACYARIYQAKSSSDRATSYDKAIAVDFPCLCFSGVEYPVGCSRNSYAKFERQSLV